LVFALAAPIRADSKPTAAESDAALAELKNGFALRKQGRFGEALPHLVQSFRLAPGLKALLNMADCEEHLGRLLDAERHWVQAREMAAAQTDDAVRQEAAERLSDLQPRVPRLTVALADAAPPTSQVTSDNVVLSGALLGVPLLYDPGRHAIEVRAEGRVQRLIEVLLHEGDDVRLEVEPGPPIEASSAPPSLESRASKDASAQPGPAATTAPVASAPAHDGSATRPFAPGADTLRYIGLGVGVLGLAAVTVGVVAGLEAEHHHTLAVDACASDCRASTTALQEQATATNLATVSSVGYVAGGVLSVSAVVMIVLASRSGSGSTTGVPHVAFAPVVDGTTRGVAFESPW
jgi:hypothetical protein